jgi:hypothetical protein
MQFDIGMLFVVIGISACSPNTCYIEYKKIIKTAKLVTFHVIRGAVSYKRGLIYKILKY